MFSRLPNKLATLRLLREDRCVCFPVFFDDSSPKCVIQLMCQTACNEPNFLLLFLFHLRVHGIHELKLHSRIFRKKTQHWYNFNKKMSRKMDLSLTSSSEQKKKMNSNNSKVSWEPSVRLVACALVLSRAHSDSNPLHNSNFAGRSRLNGYVHSDNSLGESHSA
jgi:hypothetical protein